MAHKAFVSSTFRDLAAHRREVVDAVRKSGIHVDPMEDWTADHREPKDVSRDRLEGCDLCILLVARRRGHVPEGESRSITEMEVAEALDRGIDVLVFMLEDGADWPEAFDETESDGELGIWRSHLMEHHTVGFFGADPGSVPVAPALSRWLSTRPAAPTGHSVSVLDGAVVEDVEAGSVTGVKVADSDGEAPGDVSVLGRSTVRRTKLGDITGLSIGGSGKADKKHED